MENIENYVNKLLFDDTEEVVNHNFSDTSLPVMPPPHAAETCMDPEPEPPMAVEQHAIYSELYAAACRRGDKDAGQLPQFPPSHVEFGFSTSQFPPSPAEFGSAQFPNSSAQFPNSTSQFPPSPAEFGTAQFPNSTAQFPPSSAEFSTAQFPHSPVEFGFGTAQFPPSPAEFGAAQFPHSPVEFGCRTAQFPPSSVEFGTIQFAPSLVQFGIAQFPPSPVEFSSGANTSVIVESSSTTLGSQEVPQGDQVDQISVPPIEDNSKSANTSMMQSALGSQQQSDVPQPNPAPQKSSSLEPIPILVRAQKSSSLEPIPILVKSKSKIASSGAPDTGASSQYPSQGLPTFGSSYPLQALAEQHSSWPYQQLPPAASSSLAPQQVMHGSTYQGISLDLSSKPGVISIGSIWNPRKVDLSPWIPASRTQQKPSIIGVSTLATPAAQQGRRDINASASATENASPSSNPRRRKATWEADATAENDRIMFEALIRQMQSRHPAYDSRDASSSRRAKASKESRDGDRTFRRPADRNNQE